MTVERRIWKMRQDGWRHIGTVAADTEDVNFLRSKDRVLSRSYPSCSTRNTSRYQSIVLNRVT